jgi:hypothetical protein
MQAQKMRELSVAYYAKDTTRDALTAACVDGIRRMISASTAFTNFGFDIDAAASALAGWIISNSR